MAKKIFESENLYHFTKFDNALKILLSQTLLFGKYTEMNDINESMRVLCWNLDKTDNDVKIKKEDLEKYQQISFTMDINHCTKGFEISSMWGHYAENGLGVCLVFDKELLLKEVENRWNENCKHQNIEYTREVSNWKNIDESLDEMFFKKFLDWNYENEYRIIIKSKSKYREQLNVANSLKAIVLYSMFSEDSFNPILNTKEDILKNMYLNVPIFYYGNFMGDIILKTDTESYHKSEGWDNCFSMDNIENNILDIDELSLRLPQLTKEYKLFKPRNNVKDSFVATNRRLNDVLLPLGYIKSSIILLETIKQAKDNLDRDSYIYPALYCFRHYIELIIKDSLMRLNKKLPPRKHNILKLWKELKEKISNFGEQEILINVEKIIRELDSFDKNGTSYRYASILNTNNKSKEQEMLVDIDNLEKVMLQLYSFFDGVNNMTYDIE